MSWNLQVGELQTPYLTHTQIWQATHRFFYMGKTTTTYKYGFMKALLESLATASDDYTISFDALFASFARTYWNLVMHHGLRQSNSAKTRSAVETTIEKFAQQHGIPHDWSFDALPATQQLDLIQLVKKAGKKYVVGATYSDFGGDIYAFNIKAETLTLHSEYYVFFQTHKRMLVNITNYQLALFLEKFNDAEKISRLLSKVEIVSQRQSLAQFSQMLYATGMHSCFYCGKALGTSHVDHFIPWSYMQSDDLWNFVLACVSCNTKKSNKLAAERYLDALLERNDALQHDERYAEQLVHYSEQKLIDLYTYSQLNGFIHNWTP